MSPAQPSSATSAEHAAAWDGDEGAHWIEHEDRLEAMVRPFTAPRLAAAAIADTDRVVDVGCGCGQTTRLAAREATRGHALGIDLSSAMVARARDGAADEAITNVRFEQGDAQVHRFPVGRFDVALSRFGVMFFADPPAAFTNIGAALTPGGRLALTCWQDIAHNPWVGVPAGAVLADVPLPEGFGAPDVAGPFSLSDPGWIAHVLGRAGFQDVTITGVEASVRLGDNADDAVGFLRGTGMARALLDPDDPAAAARALDAVAGTLRPYEGPDGLALGGAAWLATAHRG